VISLRHHVFSLAAVFVALAIGIAAGSTVVRGPLLDSTRDRLESAEALIDEERAENELLTAELAQLDALGVEGPAQLVADRLDGVPVIVVVAGSVDGGAVEGLIRSFRAASAELVGEIRLDGAVFDPEEAPRVGEELGLPATGSEDEQAEATGARLGELVLAARDALGAGGDVGDLLREPLGALEDDGLVDLLELPRQELERGAIDPAAVRVVVVSDRNLDHDPVPVLGAMVETLIGTAGPLAAEVGRLDPDGGDPVPSFVGHVRDSGRLRDEISTVDNVETVAGWLAVVLALDPARRGVGHWGFRGGAEGAIPDAPLLPSPVSTAP